MSQITSLTWLQSVRITGFNVYDKGGCTTIAHVERRGKMELLEKNESILKWMKTLQEVISLLTEQHFTVDLDSVDNTDSYLVCDKHGDRVLTV